VCACVAVRNPTADLAHTLSVLGQRLPAASLKLVQSEATAALASCSGGALHGAAIVADEQTEAVAFVSGGQRQHRALGWGPLFMDGGCAYDLGTRALLAAAKCSDGRGAATLLLPALLRRLNLQQPEQLVAWAYHPHEGQHERIGGLTRVVFECAMVGDVVADAILRHGVGELLR